MELSIVTTVFKSEKFIEEFIKDLCFSIEQTEITEYEIIFVLDGQTDNSKSILLEKKAKNNSIKIIELSRNFGHHYAAYAGLKYAKGELVFLIDCDLEVNPIILLDFIEILKNNNNIDVAYGVQKNRKGNILDVFLGNFFWKLFNYMSETKVPYNIATERLMRRNYLNALISLGDKNLFLGGMMYWVGFNQQGILIEKKKRSGKSTYSLKKRINLFYEAITSFSEKPIKLVFQVGLLISSSSFFSAIFLVMQKIIYPESILLGYTSLMVLLLLILGILLLSIGILGIYLARVFKQVQNRPEFIIRNIIE